MQTVNRIVTDIGEFEPTKELSGAYNDSRLRKDRQPDLRTKEGRRWRELFKAFSREKLDEYMAARG